MSLNLNSTISKIKRPAVYLTIFIIWVIGTAILFFCTNDWFLTDIVRKFKYPDDPAISFFNRHYKKKLISVSKGKIACFLPNESCGPEKLTVVIGDTLTVQVNFKNTSHTTAEETKLGLWVVGTPKGFTFHGGAASTNCQRVVGEAEIFAPYRENIVPISGTYKLYKNNKVTYCDEKAFRAHGLYIGKVEPGEIGTLVVQYAIIPKNN